MQTADKKKTKLYKIVSTDFAPIHGGSGKWFAPTKAKPGKWMPAVDSVAACASGYHLIPAKSIVEWLPRKPVEGYLCEAEGRGAQDSDGDKIAFAQARLLKVVGVLDEVSMRLAAADMAERVLPISLPRSTRRGRGKHSSPLVLLTGISPASKASASPTYSDTLAHLF